MSLFTVMHAVCTAVKLAFTLIRVIGQLQLYVPNHTSVVTSAQAALKCGHAFTPSGVGMQSILLNNRLTQWMDFCRLKSKDNISLEADSQEG